MPPEAADRLSTRRVVHGRPAKRRSLCLWLGTLASWRRGLIKSLATEHGGVSRMLDRSPEELAAAIAALAARSRSRHPAAASRKRGPGGDDADVSHEEARFEALLKGGPDACAEDLRAAPGRAVIAWCDPLYPPALRQLADAPLCLFVRADCSDGSLARRLQVLCGAPAVAVVGTRAPSSYGRDMAALLGRDLTCRGLLVISGLAMGVDAIAQAAALAAAGAEREPATVAVLGCGADVVYPRVNGELFGRVAGRGLLVSEFAWGVPARPWRFPARNRVIAALSRAVVVVEGASRSGARLTAGFALDCGREVLAVPGEAGRRLAEAPHELIRQGASLCESAADVVRALATGQPLEAAEVSGDLDPAEVAALLAARFDDGKVAAMLRVLECGAVTPDEAAKASGLPVHEVTGLLMELEIEGLVASGDGGRYRLRRR